MRMFTVLVTIHWLLNISLAKSNKTKKPFGVKSCSMNDNFLQTPDDFLVTAR